MIDLHSHVLPLVDDGPSSLDESVAMARAAVADGITILAATPHVRDDYPTRVAAMERLVEELRAALEREGVPLDVRTGGEIALDRLDALSDDELRRFGLAGNPGYLLLEFPYAGWPFGIDDKVVQLRSRGFVPVLAHPERNREVHARPERLEPLVRAGALVQLTAASVDGRLGPSSARCARRLLELELAHLLASDAHLPAIREIGLSEAARAIDDAPLARWLTKDVPGAIVAARPLPARPPVKRPSGRIARLLGR